MLCLGLMSGTSADGVDAVLAQFTGPPQRPRWQLLNHHHCPYPGELRERLVAIGQGEPVQAGALLDLAEAVTERQAAAAQAADPDGRAALIGCHGQTLWHRPPTTNRRGASWQLLQAPLLAQLLQRPVVHDFRAADLALGGQGAPLVPRADAALLGGIGGWRALLNLGGIANLTLIPPACGPDRGAPVMGWDCGPANSLIDLAVERFSEGRELFDRHGARAEAGRCDDNWLQRWLQEPYFQSSPPKSTGRESFGSDDLHRRLQQLGTGTDNDAGVNEQVVNDAVATLTAFSAAIVAQDLDQLKARTGIQPLELLVAGGGSRNPVLMAELRRRCRGVAVGGSDRFGVPAEAREALVFALLAWWHVCDYPGNAPAITGAAREARLGVKVSPA